ncbi:DUF3137 domain-containing protein [Candidatus Saccharibacteria bacterium]|nr:DUF3137 domain-containing protein [Candidatus Saccharibacteria bacterium]
MIGSLISLHPIIFFAFAGGGGSSSGGGGGGGGSYSNSSSYGGSSGETSNSPLTSWISLVFVAVIATIFLFVLRKRKKTISNKRAAREAELELAASKDPLWNGGEIEKRASGIFIQYQKDWSSFNLDSMKSYMTPGYYQHNLLMMGALKVASRQNDVRDIQITSVSIASVGDEVDSTQDSFTAQLIVNATDVLIDTKDSSELFSQNVVVTEYYKFKRDGQHWLFDGIDQETADAAMRNIPLELFAKEHNYFYSLDWGHLLLPRRGQLFNSGSFGVSDINNHVIGLYNECIIQLYTYAANPNSSHVNYLIAQTSLPKSYGNIVVRRKGPMQGNIKGLQHIKMEWSDFNSAYDVYASDEERATSFELLNPKFMEQLQALPFVINIEVVDTIVYLYSPEENLATSEQYLTMLTILKVAFKEMRM